MNSTKKRNVLLAVWLIYSMIVNVVGASVCLFRVVSDIFRSRSLGFDDFFAMVGMLANTLFLVALYRWKKWGFWGLLVSSIAAFCFTYVVRGIAAAAGCLLGIILLFFLLCIRKNGVRGWTELE